MLLAADYPVLGVFWSMLIFFVWMFLTLGLFTFVVNALMLELTDGLTSHLTIDEFWWTAIWAAIILAIVSMILDIVLRTMLASRARAST